LTIVRAGRIPDDLFARMQDGRGDLEKRYGR
jgi:hypothetical protein